MKSQPNIMVHAFILLTGVAALAAAQAETATTVPSTTSPATTSPATSAPATAPTTQASSASLLEWETDYAAALVRARQLGRPVLVRAGAVWCRWCKELDREIAKSDVQAELRRWVCVYVDIDRPPREVRSLAIGPVPAFRILDSTGRLIESRDGYMEAADLLEWLQAKYKTVAPAKSVVSQPSTAELIKELLADLDRRDPGVRESAIRRLVLVPDQAAAPVAAALSQGTLASRLAALEILQEWGGPVDGLDPWQPETLTPERLERLRTWAASPPKTASSRPTELTEPQLAAVKRDLDTLLQDEVTASEAYAVRERLARYGQLLLPLVYESVGRAQNDRVRERLTSLRYRLVASDDLVFSWSGGLERLAALDVETRHAAADELVGRCGRTDEQLLLELFSDPDGLVREIALRGLNKIGGAQASGALVRLLKDPEPNVRAAVLKQMAESPSPQIVPAVADYVQTEKDADLVVHAIRVLRSAKGKNSAQSLVNLLDHGNWQVRAEAAEGLGEILSDGDGLSADLRKEARSRLLKLLEDTDGFVVSVAVKALRGSGATGAVDALAKAADQHPELAADILEMLGETSELRVKALPHLRRFCAHENASVRAVAIRALCTAAPMTVEKELSASLADSSSRVRISAAGAFLQILDTQRPQNDVDSAVHVQAQQSLFGSLFGGLRKNSQGKAGPATQTATGPADSQPASRPAGSGVSAEVAKNERWLEHFRSGTRPKWMDSMLPPLEAMLTAESAEERVLAGVALVALGKEAAALPVITAAVQGQRDLTGTASRALPWLPWEARLQLFEQLSPLAVGPGTVMQIAQNLATWQDPRAAKPMWDRLAGSEMNLEGAAQMLEFLRRIYFGDFSYNPSGAPAERRRQAIADATERTQSGPEFQRTVALALLLGVSTKDAATQAAQVVADPNATESLRADGFHIQLLAQTRTAGQKLAVTALDGSDLRRQRLALRYLALGPESLNSLRDGAMYLYYQNSEAGSYSEVTTGQPIRVAAPAGVKPEALRPLLTGTDPELAALAGYVLATLKDPSGLDVLVTHWRERARDDQNIRKLVYRAVVALDDDSRSPLLEEVYRSFPPKDYWLRDYYWTIRSMSGPNVVKLRKVVRDEVGMDNLR